MREKERKDPMIRLENAEKNFSGGRGVRGISFSIPKGGIACLTGPSGCGKTTVLRLIAGLERPSAGGVFLGGRCVSAPGVLVPPHERRIGMVFQDCALWPHMTARGNVGLPLRAKGVRRRERERRVEEALAMVLLPRPWDVPPSELSGGERQRVALARALVHRPEILLCDEPFAGMDAELRERIAETIVRLHRELGFTLLCATHQHDGLAARARISVFMERGGPCRVVGTG
jgi:iron(III) transport system ATP-binding protein